VAGGGFLIFFSGYIVILKILLPDKKYFNNNYPIPYNDLLIQRPSCPYVRHPLIIIIIK
jgi:hypothetical protein